MFRGREVEKGGPDFSGFRGIRSGKNGAEKILKKRQQKFREIFPERESVLPAQKKTAMVAV